MSEVTEHKAITTEQATSSKPKGADHDKETPPEQTQQTQNKFPHAFERWERLSVYWEQLTRSWIRKIQESTEEAQHETTPLTVKLSRQVTDLHIMSRNLFDAMVEFQRLRASSERKFQRWFFETRAELERHQEVKSRLEMTLDDERKRRGELAELLANIHSANANINSALQHEQRLILSIIQYPNKSSLALGNHSPPTNESVT